MYHIIECDSSHTQRFLGRKDRLTPRRPFTLPRVETEELLDTPFPDTATTVGVPVPVETRASHSSSQASASGSVSVGEVVVCRPRLCGSREQDGGPEGGVEGDRLYFVLGPLVFPVGRPGSSRPP